MTLKEKLDVIKNYDEQDPHETFMRIADDYAIEFSNWLFNIDKEVLKKQLNEFKKEKEL